MTPPPQNGDLASEKMVNGLIEKQAESRILPLTLRQRWWISWGGGIFNKGSGRVLARWVIREEVS